MSKNSNDKFKNLYINESGIIEYETSEKYRVRTGNEKSEVRIFNDGRVLKFESACYRIRKLFQQINQNIYSKLYKKFELDDIRNIIIQNKFPLTTPIVAFYQFAYLEQNRILNILRHEGLQTPIQEGYKIRNDNGEFNILTLEQRARGEETTLFKSNNITQLAIDNGIFLENEDFSDIRGSKKTEAVKIAMDRNIRVLTNMADSKSYEIETLLDSYAALIINGISVDAHGENVFYNPKTGFEVIDIDVRDVTHANSVINNPRYNSDSKKVDHVMSYLIESLTNILSENKSGYRKDELLNQLGRFGKKCLRYMPYKEETKGVLEKVCRGERLIMNP